MLAPTAADAQTATTGVVTGTVIDNVSKKGMPDVVVEVSGSTGEQVVVTDSSGGYRIPNLAPGTYTVRVSNDGYKPSGSSVTLNANQTIRVNVALTPTALQAAEVVVVGKAPTVDVGSATTGVVMTKEFTQRVALSRPTGKGGAARSFESIAEVAPGAKNDDYGVSINGTTSPENRYIVDGLSVNNPAYGIVGTPLSVEFVKEVSVISGGYMPEFGRSTGGVLNVVTESGSNEFHGSAWVNVSPGAIEGERKRFLPAGITIRTDRNVDLIHDFGVKLGGPILKDKLWFFGGISFNSTRWRNEQNLYRSKVGSKPLFDDQGNPHPEVGNQFEFADKDPTVDADGDGDPANDGDGDPVTELVPNTKSVRPAIQRGIQYMAKLTFAPNADNNIELSVFGAPTSSGGNGTWGINPDTGGIEGGANDYSASAHTYTAEATGVNLKWSSAFDNKTLLIDANVGWHHQKSGRGPSDGSAIGSKDGLAGMPSVSWLRSVPVHHDLKEFRPNLTAAECADAIVQDVDNDGDGVPDATVVRDPQCPATTYFSGGPDFVNIAELDRIHGKLIATKLFQGLGHHVVKAGFDFEHMSYNHTKAYTGTVRYSENGTGSAFNHQRRYGFLTGPDNPSSPAANAVIQDLQTAASTSVQIGAFVQDSWNFLDKVTVNLGVRYDSQYMLGADGKVGLALPFQLAPRVGVIYDITQSGRSKIFANFARYYESIPLDMADRAFPGESQIGARNRAALCDPTGRDPMRDCNDPASFQSRARVFGTSFDPNQYWFATGASKVPVDPNLQPQASDEIIVGGEYEVFPDGRVGAQYTHRYMVAVIEDMSRDEATTYFIGNPGTGIAKDFPAGQRDYDGVNIYFTKNFSDKWLAQVSYTLSFLRGNIAGLFRPETGQLDPNINSDFDLKSLTVNRYGALPGDRTHEIKVYAARDFPFNEFIAGPANMQLNLGLGYNGRSGGPTSFLAAHPIYGTSEVHILPRGSGDRLPWTHSIDTHIQYDLKLSKDAQLSVYMDIFNLFNFQETTAIDEDYTFIDVDPVADPKPTIKNQDGVSEPDPSQLVHQDGSPFDPAEKNPNFGKPIAFQAPRQFRFGARVTF